MAHCARVARVVRVARESVDGPLNKYTDVACEFFLFTNRNAALNAIPSQTALIACQYFKFQILGIQNIKS